jgi:DNA-binding NtrC family response regulator
MEGNIMKQSILYLDDEPACLRLFIDVLGMDFDVRTARDHAEAFRLLSERQSNIIISDHKMPDVEGTRFLREVAEKYPRSCRVLLTGSVTVGDMFLEVGRGDVHFFLAKPWTEQNMRQALERAGFILFRDHPESGRSAARSGIESPYWDFTVR